MSDSSLVLFFMKSGHFIIALNTSILSHASFIAPDLRGLFHQCASEQGATNRWVYVCAVLMVTKRLFFYVYIMG